jgi:hypothetical protein
MEDKIGSIASGKFADFVILDNNPLDYDKTKLRDIKVHGTIVGGNEFLTKDIKDPKG